MLTYHYFLKQRSFESADEFLNCLLLLLHATRLSQGVLGDVVLLSFNANAVRRCRTTLPTTELAELPLDSVLSVILQTNCKARYSQIYPCSVRFRVVIGSCRDRAIMRQPPSRSTAGARAGWCDEEVYRLTAQNL